MRSQRGQGRSSTSRSSPCSRSCSPRRRRWRAAERRAWPTPCSARSAARCASSPAARAPPSALAPCVVASKRDARHVAVTILLVRLDGDRYVLRETLSDGTVRLTLAHRGGAGVELGVGARAKVKLKGRTLGLDDELRGGGEGVLGYGEVFVARNDREADKILRRDAPPPPARRRRRARTRASASSKAARAAWPGSGSAAPRRARRSRRCRSRSSSGRRRRAQRQRHDHR